MIRGAGTRTAVLLAALVSAGFLAALLAATRGRFVPPITDLYVVCQYAKAMAEGHPFQYEPGAPPSTGATSLLHTALLAMGWASGFRGEGLVAFALLTGAALLAASAAIAARLGERLAGPREGALAGALVALGGPVAWGCLYGSDIALFLFLATCLFERLVATWDEPAATSAVVAAFLLVLARPEGLPIAIVLGVVWLVRGGRVRALAPAAGGLAILVLNRALTGSWVGSSGAEKSLFATYGVREGAALLAEYAVDVVRGLLLGFYPSQAPVGLARGWAALAFPPLGLVFVLVALVRSGTAVRLWAGLVAGVCALAAPNVFLGVHFNRYLLWAYPSLLVLVAVGLGRALEPRLFRATAAVFLALGALSTLRFALLNAEMAGGIARRDLEAARFIASELPPGVAIANAATSVEYLTGHRSVNLHGVTTPAFFGGRTAEREASTLEGLGRLGAAERPGLLLTSEKAQAAQATLRALADGPPLFRTTSLSDDELLLHRTRWSAFDAASEPRLEATREALVGRTEVDRLNVGDPLDEARHAYACDTRLGDLVLRAAARVEADADGAVVADAGRAILGAESFRLRHAPGRDVVLVLRTAREIEATVWQASGVTRHVLSFEAARLSLRAGGRVAASAEFRPRDGWDEVVLLVPGDRLTGSDTAFEVSGRFASFRYWAYQ